eukprot:1025407-Rhodomonas_salina.3
MSTLSALEIKAVRDLLASSTFSDALPTNCCYAFLRRWTGLGASVRASSPHSASSLGVSSHGGLTYCLFAAARSRWQRALFCAGAALSTDCRVGFQAGPTIEARPWMDTATK